MSKNPFRKIRGIKDSDLNAALTNHAHVIGGVAHAVTMLLRERRLLLLLNVAQVLGLIWMALHAR